MLGPSLGDGRSVMAISVYALSQATEADPASVWRQPSFSAPAIGPQLLRPWRVRQHPAVGSAGGRTAEHALPATRSSLPMALRPQHPAGLAGESRC